MTQADLLTLLQADLNIVVFNPDPGSPSSTI